MSLITFENVQAYVAVPHGPQPTKAILLLSEWWGLNQQIKGLSDRFAAQGFIVVAPDLYHGKVTEDADEANHLMSGLDFKAAVAECDVWMRYLKESKGITKVGVMGFCMGGALTLACGSDLAGKVGAISVFYGIPDFSYFPPSKIECPILLNFGTEDPLEGFSRKDRVKQLTDELDKAGKKYEMEWYEGTGHAFMNEARPETYNAECAIRGFANTAAFFLRNLNH